MRGDSPEEKPTSRGNVEAGELDALRYDLKVTRAERDKAAARIAELEGALALAVEYMDETQKRNFNQARAALEGKRRD